MQKTIGILMLVGGMILIFWGYNQAQSIKGQVNRLFTSSEKNRTTWAYVGGAVLCTAGVFTIFGAKK